MCTGLLLELLGQRDVSPEQEGHLRYLLERLAWQASLTAGRFRLVLHMKDNQTRDVLGIECKCSGC